MVVKCQVIWPVSSDLGSLFKFKINRRWVNDEAVYKTGPKISSVAVRQVLLVILHVVITPRPLKVMEYGFATCVIT